MADSGRKDDEVVALKLAGGSTVAETAHDAKVSERSVFRRLVETAVQTL